MESSTEFKFDGCRVRYLEGTIVLESTQDSTDRAVWTAPDADAMARVFRMLHPGLAQALKSLASFARMRRTQERRGGDE